MQLGVMFGRRTRRSECAGHWGLKGGRVRAVQTRKLPLGTICLTFHKHVNAIRGKMWRSHTCNEGAHKTKEMKCKGRQRMLCGKQERGDLVARLHKHGAGPSGGAELGVGEHSSNDRVQANECSNQLRRGAYHGGLQGLHHDIVHHTQATPQPSGASPCHPHMGLHITTVAGVPGKTPSKTSTAEPPT